MPGWRFELLLHNEGPMLRIIAELPDSNRTGMTPLRIESFIPPSAQHNYEGFIEWLRWRLNRVFQHEVDEWLRYQGQRIHDPHRPLEQQIRVA